MDKNLFHFFVWVLESKVKAHAPFKLLSLATLAALPDLLDSNLKVIFISSLAFHFLEFALGLSD